MRKEEGKMEKGGCKAEKEVVGEVESKKKREDS